MIEIERIRDQLRTAAVGRVWHGPSVLERLAVQHDLYRAGQIALSRRAG